MDRIVLCMKWGALYGPEYVNVLYNAVRDHITGPFRFVCLTDRADGFLPEIEARPIPDLGLGPEHWGAGAWPKLGVFSQDLYGLTGRALFIDLDTMIAGDLDPFFDQESALIALDSRPWRYKEGLARTGTGIFAFTLGALGNVVEHFTADIPGHTARYINEQDFLHSEFANLGHGPITYWPDPWIASFKYHQRQPLLLDRIRGPKPPGPDVRVLCFHGKPRPIELIRPPKGNWDVFPHYGRGQVDWMVDYWTRYGGKV